MQRRRGPCYSRQRSSADWKPCRSGSSDLTVPSLDITPAEPAPAYVPATGWPAWAVLPAGVGLFLVATAIGVAASGLYAAVAAHQGADVSSPAVAMHALIVWLGSMQIALIGLTFLAARMFGSNPRDALALRPPRGGWGVLGLALIPLFAVTGIWTALLLWLAPDVVVGDLRVFKELLDSDMALAALLVIGIGAPLSEELMFRGFLFSGLAKSRLGLVGTGLLTAVLWTALHYGYSIFGLIEVLMIGLYFSWLLVRTGSVWVTIFCHAVYNSVIGIALYYISLPPLPAPVVP